MSVRATVKKVLGKETSFPCIMISEEHIVLFICNKCGTVIAHPKDSKRGWSIGYYSSVWNMDSFKPLEGSVELSNDTD